jgi:fructose-specific phosphotransferase system IIA component
VPVSIDDLIEPDLVVLDLDAPDSASAIGALADRMADKGRVTDRDAFVDTVLAREKETGGTGMESGIAIPHGKHAAVARASVAFGRVAGGVDFGAADAPSDLVFLIAAPDGADDLHITVLSRLARKLIYEDFRNALRNAPTPEAVVDTLREGIQL